MFIVIICRGQVCLFVENACYCESEFVMKWDMSSIPPRAWFVEDGDWVPVDQSLVQQCEVCTKWFIANPLFNKSVCSVGCNLQLLESRKEKNEEDKKI